YSWRWSGRPARRPLAKMPAEQRGLHEREGSPVSGPGLLAPNTRTTTIKNVLSVPKGFLIRNANSINPLRYLFGVRLRVGQKITHDHRAECRAHLHRREELAGVIGNLRRASTVRQHNVLKVNVVLA